MTKAERIVADLSEGERAERRLRLRFWRTMALAAAPLMLASFALGLRHGLSGQPPAMLVQALPPAAAIAMVAAYAVTSFAIVLLWYRRCDEFELRAQYLSNTVAVNALVLIYAPWWTLWQAGLAPEPTHYPLMAILLVAGLLGYAYARLR